MQQLGSVQFEV